MYAEKSEMDPMKVRQALDTLKDSVRSGIPYGRAEEAVKKRYELSSKELHCLRSLYYI